MPAVSSVSPSGISYIDWLESGTKWAVNDFTYSFPTSASFYVGLNGSAYGSGEQNSGFKPFNAVQQAATTSILNMYSQVANVTFTQITETSTQSATLRYAGSSMPTTAWGYYPSPLPEGGDAWFNSTGSWYTNPVVGNYGWLTIIHETGHLLGLKHPQDIAGSFGAAPVSADSLEYTVMSYRSYIGASTTQGLTNATWSFPQTLMMYDIAALQYMYGANYNTNSGDTVYKWNPSTGQETINGVAQAAPGGNTIFMTTWDGGGSDTYDFSNYTTNVTVSLQPGGWTTASTAQLANLGGGHYAAGNIANAYLFNNNPASLIENAVGGTGNDVITGNIANNKLTGGAGNDTLDGVSGTDTAVYSGPSSAYQVTQNADGSWKVVDLRAGSPDGTDTLKNIDFLQFSDTTIAVGTVPPPPPPVVQVPAISAVTPDTGTVGDGITNASVLTVAGTAQAGMTIKLYDGANLLGSTVANASGNWTFVTTALNDGTHSFTATASDASGNTSAASGAKGVIVDTAAPVSPTVGLQSVDSGIAGDNITNVKVVSLTGVAEINSTIKVYDGGVLLGAAVANAEGVWNLSLDMSDDQAAALAGAGLGGNLGLTGDAGGTSQTQSWAFTTAPLADGTHNFTVTSTDAAGNVSTVSALNVTIDTVAPNAPVITSFSNDSGVAGDHITSDNTLTLTGTAEANATVNVYDGAMLLKSVVADATGAWSYTTGVLTDGVHNLTAAAVDRAGNTGTASAPLSLTIDTTAAAVAQTTASPATGTKMPGDTVVITVKLNEAVSVSGTPTLLLNDGGKATYTAGSGTDTLTFSYTVATTDTSVSALAIASVSLPNGATISDAAGNAADLSGAVVSFPGLQIDPPTGPVTTKIWNSDGTLHEVIVTGITGARYTASDTLYANNKPVSAVWTNGSTVVQTETWNADGTVHDIHYYGLTGAYSDYDVVYANNKPASATYSNGMTQTWNYNADGSLHQVVYSGVTGQRYTASETLYANNKPVSAVWTNGSTVVQTETWNADGTVHDIHYYGLAGAYADYDVVYANNKPASATYSNGMTQTWTYNADGSLHQVVYSGVTGQRYTASETLYANNKPVSAVWTNGTTVVQTETWNADGTVHDIHYYGLTGAYSDYDVVYANNKPASATYSNGMTQTWTYNADGSLHQVVYNGIVGARYTASETLYANGKPVSAVWTNGSTVMQTETWNADGTVHDIHYYGLTGAYADYEVIYANNKPASATYSNGMTQAWNYNADGSLHEVVYNGIAGARYTSSETLYANGKPVSAVWTNGATVMQTQAWNADGTVHDIHYYGLTGAYTDYDVVYANNKPASATYSNGMTASWSYNADGSLHEVVYDGIAGARYTSSETLYANGKPVSAVWTNGETVMQTQTWNADGTVHDVHYYGLTGAYSDYDVVYANNKPASASYSNGMTQSWGYNADGSLHEVVYNGIVGQPWTSSETFYENGKPVSAVWTTGDATSQSEAATIVRSQTWNADGSVHDIHYFGITGQAYTDYDVIYANNKPVSALYSNGMTQTWTYNSDGSSVISFDNVEGKSYTATASIYDPHNDVGGHLALQQVTNTNGTQTLRSYDDGLTVTIGSAGANVQLPGASGNAFHFDFKPETAVTGSTGADNLVLQSGFGHVTVTAFGLESGAGTNNDVVTISGGAFKDFADMLAHASQDAAGNTHITDAAGDVLTLSHVSIAALQPNHFIIT